MVREKKVKHKNQINFFFSSQESVAFKNIVGVRATSSFGATFGYAVIAIRPDFFFAFLFSLLLFCFWLFGPLPFFYYYLEGDLGMSSSRRVDQQQVFFSFMFPFHECARLVFGWGCFGEDFPVSQPCPDLKIFTHVFLSSSLFYSPIGPGRNNQRNS